MSLLNFTLRPIEDLDPWGNEDELSLDWSGLSGGVFWLEAGQATLLEYSLEAHNNGADTVFGRQVARFHEDLTALLPFVLEPVPDALATFLRRGIHEPQTLDQDTNESELRWKTRAKASGWIGRRTLPTGYMSPGARICLWSDADQVHIDWNNRDKFYAGVPAWSAAGGSFSITRTAFTDAVSDFHARFIQQMAQRIRQIGAGVLAPEIAIDTAGLLRDHEVHSRALDAAFKPQPSPPQWDVILAACQDWERMRRRT